MTITPSFTRVLLALVASSLTSASVVKAQQRVDSGSATTVAFVHVNVVPMNRELVLTDQTVVVQDDRILPSGKDGCPCPFTDTHRVPFVSGEWRDDGIQSRRAPRSSALAQENCRGRDAGTGHLHHRADFYPGE